jgi:hypothetical protein
MKKILILLILISGFLQIACCNCAIAKKKKYYTPIDEYKYEQKVYQKQIKEDYEKSNLPESGYMSMEEYEAKSKEIPNEDKKIPAPPFETSNYYMEYIPQPTYSLVKYNVPAGDDELDLKRRIKTKHQLNGEGITSPDKTIMVYPVTYYYPESQTTAGALFIIPLDTSLPEVDRILRANVIKRIPTPILATTKDITEKYIFRTMTPIDFSPDGTKLLAKEKIGYVNDGIWQTNLWIYDFAEQRAIRTDNLRSAIKKYWRRYAFLRLNLKRWDIFPIGFNADNPEEIIVQAYGFTGSKPFFLGNWKIRTDGTKPTLISRYSCGSTIASSGFHLIQTGVVNPVVVKDSQKQIKKTQKKQEKIQKRITKKEIKAKKRIVKRQIKEMKKTTKKNIKQYKKYMKRSAPLGS